MLPKSRIMYIEYKGDGIVGPARIGRVTFSKSGKSIYYMDQMFKRCIGCSKSNYYDTETNKEYWISGCHKDGVDGLYATDAIIDDDVREEYWTQIRNQPENILLTSIRVKSKY